MNKVSCNIIKDLLPSYIEEICSEETKEFVNSHLKECKECRDLIKIMQKTELVSERTDRKIVDSVKKVKRHIRKMIGFGIGVGLIGISMAILSERFGLVPVSFYYIVMPVFLFLLHSILSDYKAERKYIKQNIGIGVAEVILIGYSIFLEFWCVQWVLSGNYPFGLEENRVGVFLSYQFWSSTVIQGILFAVIMWLHIRKESANRMVIYECVLGVCINQVFLSLLHGLDTMERFIAIRNRTLGIVLGEWIVVVGILGILSLSNKMDKK